MSEARRLETCFDAAFDIKKQRYGFDIDGEVAELEAIKLVPLCVPGDSPLVAV